MLQRFLYYFPDWKTEEYANCHSEKGPFEDYLNGLRIPLNFVRRYHLFEFNISPELHLKHKYSDEEIKYVAGVHRTYQGHDLFLYHIGINVDASVTPPYEALDTRLLILKDGEVSSNYFIGGYLIYPGQSEVVVSRQISLIEDEVSFEHLEDFGANVPSHLRIPPQESLPL